MPDTGGHHGQGHIEGIQAVAVARRQVEHRPVGQQIQRFVCQLVSVHKWHWLTVRKTLQETDIDLFRHMPNVEDKHPILGPLQMPCRQHVFGSGGSGNYIGLLYGSG
ncbi:hypothetical protein D3C72_2100010 [compost metagenome]